MSIVRNFLLALGLLIIATGCAKEEDPANTGAGGTQATPAGTTASVDKAKCEGCGNEVAKAELVSHDGKMMCKACIEAHNHG